MATDPVDLLRRLYPADHPRPARRTTPRSPLDELVDGRPGRHGPLPAAAVARSGTRPARRACPGSWHGCGRPAAAPGIASRTTARCGRSCSRRRTRSTTRSRAGLDAEARRGARRPAAPDRAPRPVRRRGGHLRPVRRPAVDHDQDRAPTPARVRGCGRQHRRRGDPQLGAHQGRRARRGRGGGTARRADADPDMPAAFAGLSRSLPALAYADEMQDRAASLGYDWPDLEGVIDKVAEEATRAARGERRRRTDRGVRRPAVRARQPGPQAGHRPGGVAAGGASRKFASASRASSGSPANAAWS